MLRLILPALAGLLLLLCSNAMAEETSPEQTIIDLFDAMRAGDKEALLAQWAEGAELKRITSKGELRPDGLEWWAKWVGTLEEGQADEHIFDVKVQEFGNLATVWAPFKIYIDGDLKGCGVNTFTLVKLDGDWKIVYGIDTDHSGNCDEYGPKAD